MPRRKNHSSPAKSIILILIALFIWNNFPSLFLFLVAAYILILLVLQILIPLEERKHKRNKKKTWTADAVFERRMKIANDVGEWSSKPRLEAVTARLENGGFSGKIKTSTGRELWRCSHQHWLKPQKPGTKHRSRRSRFTPPTNKSQEAALRCARKELEKNYHLHSSMVNKLVVNNMGSNLRRSKLKNDPQDSIEEILNTFGNKCAYCGISGLTKAGTHQDHVVPLSKGGSNLSSNMLPACLDCNIAKGEKNIFDFLIELELGGKKLPTWIDASETWQKFKSQLVEE